MSSVETIIQLAAENFIQSTSEGRNDELSLPYPSLGYCRSDDEDSQGVQLVQNLLSCAEKVSAKQYERAYMLLDGCDVMSSSLQDNPLTRLVQHFIEALYEKINRESGRNMHTYKGLMGKKAFEDPLELIMRNTNLSSIAFHKELMISQINKFAEIQAIVENIAEASRVHFIDFQIGHGIQCTILMQALAARHEIPIQYLKITAVGTKSEDEIGKQLTSFAKTLDLQFSFHTVKVGDMLELDRTLFELDSNEEVVVNASFILTFMIGRSNQLEHLMRVIRSINPCVMIVAEVEANCNSPIFVERLVEALFYYDAFFECMDESMKNEEEHRCLAEATIFSRAIRNIVATNGEEWKIRHVNFSVWRAFFTYFGFEETELSSSSVYQANLVLKNFTSGNYFTFDTDGKSLIIGWKGTPLSSLSAWKPTS